MKKIWILYICTWQYSIFRENFYESCEKFLLPDTEKVYFVFTDSKQIKSNDKIHIIYQKNLWWPNNTLKRFHMFLSIEEKLKKMDYLYFFNANLEIKTTIFEEDFLPDRDNQIVVCLHPRFYNKKNTDFLYDRNPNSTAYIKKWEWEIYVQWGLNWWVSNAFLEICKTLKDNIDIDEKKWIIALWHDESHLNKYIYNLIQKWLSEKYKILSPGYLYPEKWLVVHNHPELKGIIHFLYPRLWRITGLDCKILNVDKSKYINIQEIKWIKKKYLFIRKILSKYLFKYDIIKIILLKYYFKIYLCQ